MCTFVPAWMISMSLGGNLVGITKKYNLLTAGINSANQVGGNVNLTKAVQSQFERNAVV